MDNYTCIRGCHKYYVDCLWEIYYLYAVSECIKYLYWKIKENANIRKFWAFFFSIIYNHFRKNV